MNRRRLTATILATVLLLASTACGTPPRERLVKIAGYGQQLAAQLEAHWTLPDTLLREGVIDAAKHAFIRQRFDNAKRLTAAFNEGMGRVLATETLDTAALVGIVADLISEVTLLTSQVKSETYRKALLIVEISLRSISGYFATQIKTARAHGYTDERLARHAELSDIRLIESYARSL